jgi:hypothetical protein
LKPNFDYLRSWCESRFASQFGKTGLKENVENNRKDKSRLEHRKKKTKHLKNHSYPCVFAM